jgi:hypothetical protein
VKGRTAAEEQIEMLRKMKEDRASTKAPPPSAPAAAPFSAPAASVRAAVPARVPGTASRGSFAPPPEGNAAFELAESGPAKPKRKSGHGLPVGRETWRRILERQRLTREFKGRKEMGEWAAQLLLNLPARAHTLDPQAREELFRRMREWCEARGLR